MIVPPFCCIKCDVLSIQEYIEYFNDKIFEITMKFI